MQVESGALSNLNPLEEVNILNFQEKFTHFGVQFVVVVPKFQCLPSSA